MTVGGPLSPFLSFFLGLGGAEKVLMSSSRLAWVMDPSNLSESEVRARLKEQRREQDSLARDDTSSFEGGLDAVEMSRPLRKETKEPRSARARQGARLFTHLREHETLDARLSRLEELDQLLRLGRGTGSEPFEPLALEHFRFVQDAGRLGDGVRFDDILGLQDVVTDCAGAPLLDRFLDAACRVSNGQPSGSRKEQDVAYHWAQNR